MNKISIIIPVLNEADCIGRTLQAAQSLRQSGHEVIIVDGGSVDNTYQLAAGMADQIITTSPGRATQMNAGAGIATGNIFVFLHADTILPVSAEQQILSVMKEQVEKWGRFNVKLSGKHWLFRVIEFCMNLRTRLTGIVTGDHILFMHRTLFEMISGFPEIELMEDIAITSKLIKYSPPVCLDSAVITSSRRWEQQGIVKTIILMWWLRYKFFMGADPVRLARQYD